MSDHTDLAPSSGALLRRERPDLAPALFELPPRYGRDRARLSLVDPHLVHFSWEVADGTLARGSGRAGELGVRLVRLDGAERAVASEGGVQAVMTGYWPAEPLGRYRAEVGWRGPDGAFEPWLSSNELAVPRTQPSVTASVRWRVRGERSLREVGRGASEPLFSERAEAAASLSLERELPEVAAWRAIAWSRTARP